MTIRILLPAALASLLAFTAAAAPPPKPDDTRLGELPGDSVSHHTLAGAGSGAALAYTATAGTLALKDDAAKTTAKMFYVSYVADRHDGARPVAFFFNGGPGAATAYLHLGAAGPVVLDFPDGDPTNGAGARLAANPDSWLRFADLVFIDAIGTGYSLPADPDKAAKQFWGVEQDGSAFANAIHLWLVRNHREASPKYLVGESYGGVRSIETAWALQMEQSILLDGIVMVSPAIDTSLIGGSDPIASAFEIPAFTAANLDRQGKLSQNALDAAYAYAFGPYLSTLAGPLPKGADADAFYARIADLTGLPKAVIAKERGQIDPQAHDVRSRDGRLYSMYDATQSIADPYPEGEDDADSPDPVLFGYGRAYGNAFTAYVDTTLGFHTDLTYDLLDLKVNGAWEWKSGDDVVAKTIPKLRKLLALDPALRIFIANGFFDTVCPFAGTRYIVSHIPVGQERVQTAVYPGGHMLYTRPGSRAALSHDVAGFFSHTG